MHNKIIIELNNKDINVFILNYINFIINIRRIDSKIRIDIKQNIIKNNLISFMCDKITDYGSNNYLQILKQKLVKENLNFKYIVVLLVLDIDNKLENVIEARNCEEIINKNRMMNKDIVFMEDNYYFFNFIKAIKSNNETIDNIIKNERKLFF